jgi:hypothetical protein
VADGKPGIAIETALPQRRRYTRVTHCCQGFNCSVECLQVHYRQRSGIAEGGIFCVPSADTEADLFSIAEDNICS